MEILKFYYSGKKISVQTTYPIKKKKKASEKIDKRKDENQEHG